VVDRFQLVIDITNLLRYLCFDTNQSIPTSQSYLTKTRLSQSHAAL
jgi:hypothetical protein